MVRTMVVMIRMEMEITDVESMISQNIQMRDDEGDDFEPIRTNTVGPIPIKTLFNFGSTCWHDFLTKAALQSFDEELETYELFGLDVQGEEDLDLDDSMHDMLCNQCKNAM